MKFIIDNIFLIGIALISGGALFFPMLQRRGAKVTQLQATQYINQGKTLILDVRNAEEFAAGHLPNAKHIPLPDLANRLKEIEKSKNQVVITVCASGVRSASAASVLAKAGFTQVFSLEGGTNAWREQGLPITK
ncbi:rhodanese-like domain-containing protein [Undibacterium curvum]|uniref:Rhodanese-like domain-containing protein n=1 Tax=Undibacterium curvum TaxID=2762294 RepID=A0ABR7A5E1_9BURK|nr:rhodanese-like domain-containing protein [Undibacterium curvum]MBC3932116.1 rhodanese-like domain-containing protein [Undibacterium curvum]